MKWKSFFLFKLVGLWDFRVRQWVPAGQVWQRLHSCKQEKTKPENIVVGVVHWGHGAKPLVSLVVTLKLLGDSEGWSYAVLTLYSFGMMCCWLQLKGKSGIRNNILRFSSNPLTRSGSRLWGCGKSPWGSKRTPWWQSPQDGWCALFLWHTSKTLHGNLDHGIGSHLKNGDWWMCSNF